MLSRWRPVFNYRSQVSEKHENLFYTNSKVSREPIYRESEFNPQTALKRSREKTVGYLRPGEYLLFMRRLNFGGL